MSPTFCRVFLAEQIEFLQPNLEEMIPPGKKAFLKQFYSQVCPPSICSCPAAFPIYPSNLLLFVYLFSFIASSSGLTLFKI